MSDPHFTDAEKSRGQPSRVTRAEWVDYGDQADYVDLARRLNACAVQTKMALQAQQPQ
jgi:hypothetical protein